MIGEKKSGQAHMNNCYTMSCSQNEHTGFKGEKNPGRMKGEKQCGQVIGENSHAKHKFTIAILCQVKPKFTIDILCHWFGDRLKKSGQAHMHDCYAMSLVR